MIPSKGSSKKLITGKSPGYYIHIPCYQKLANVTEINNAVSLLSRTMHPLLLLLQILQNSNKLKVKRIQALLYND